MNIKWIGLAGICISLMAGQTSYAETRDQTKKSTEIMATHPVSYGHKADQAPEQLMHLGKLAGHWILNEEALDPKDGSWKFAQEAEWTFSWGIGGWSIVDDYVAPSFATKLDDENIRQRGTNTRFFNKADNKWIMAWVTTRSKTPQGFTAISDDQTVVMLSDDPYVGGNYVRITFFNMAVDSFDWKMELSKEQESGWKEMYRIHGTRD
jgi:hypothetical protein